MSISTKNGNSLQMKVFNSIQEVDFRAWEDLRNHHNLLTEENYFRVIEEAKTLDCEHRYFEFLEDERLICTMYGFIRFNDAAELSGEFPAKIIRIIRHILPNFLNIKTLEVGSPITIGKTISTSSDINMVQVQEISSLLRTYARGLGIQMVLLRDFMGEKTILEDALSSAGFSTVMNFPLAMMNIQWDSMEQYLAAMIKRYRSEARRKMRAKKTQSIRTIILNDRRALERVTDYVDLYKKMMERSKEFPREFIGEDYHTAMNKYFNENSFWMQYLDGETLVAFCHFLVYKGTFYGHYMGLDYDISHKAMLYFNFFYDTIEFAIKNKIRNFEAGVTTYEAKTTAGLSVYPIRMYLWHKNPIYLWLFCRAYYLLTDFNLVNCHYVFQGKEHQEIWDGKNRN